MRLELSGAALYRLGCFAGDGALRSLGAAIHRARAVPSPTVTGRLLDASLRADLEADFSPAPRLKHAALEDGRLMLSRGAGFFCCLTSGGDRGNVGDICVFLDRACVLSAGNLPLSQLPRPLCEPQPDWDFSDASRAIMGVDVTGAYAAEEGVRAHQDVYKRQSMSTPPARRETSLAIHTASEKAVSARTRRTGAPSLAAGRRTRAGPGLWEMHICARRRMSGAQR